MRTERRKHGIESEVDRHISARAKDGTLILLQRYKAPKKLLNASVSRGGAYAFYEIFELS